VLKLVLPPRPFVGEALMEIPRRHTGRVCLLLVVGSFRIVEPEVSALDAVLPAVWHRTEQYANNCVECDHGRLKSRL
jgi:hypothetical protein